MVIIRTNIYIFLYICEHIFVSMDFLKLSEAHTINLVFVCYMLYSVFVFVRVFLRENCIIKLFCPFLKNFLSPSDGSNISSAHQASENIDLHLFLLGL